MAKIWNKPKQSNTSLKKKVFVALSGGVDSSVAAALLKEQGHAVAAVFIKIWSPEWVNCTSAEDRHDAERVAAYLGIPFKTLDLTDEYKREVVGNMIAEYAAGRTPNPDVMCNKQIKFGAFFDWAMNEGADYIATGHYAQITGQISRLDSQFSNKLKKTNSNNKTDMELSGIEICDIENCKLKISEDYNKDQTYFLWTLTQKHLARTIFPIGGYKKEQVRELARNFGLPTAERRESQGLCFVGHLDIKAFLKKYLPENPGDVLNQKGQAIGTHAGAHFYTVGERHGFKINTSTPDSPPYYIVQKDMERNTLIVAPHSCGKLNFPHGVERTKAKISLREVNWINLAPKQEDKLRGRIRHRGALELCSVSAIGAETALVEFYRRTVFPASGQSLALYRGDECVGGGIIT